MKTLTLLFYMCFALNIKAQQKDSLQLKKRSNIIALNVGGEGFYYGPTATFEKSIVHSKYIHLGFGLGIGKFLTKDPFGGPLCLPTYFNIKFGKNRHFLELNFGVNHLVDFNPYPKTRKERIEYKKKSPFDTQDYRPFYEPSYFTTVNYVFKGYNGFVFKVGCTVSKTKFDLGHPAYTHILPRLSIGYAFS